MRTVLLSAILLAACSENHLHEIWHEPELAIETPAAAAWMSEGHAPVEGRFKNLTQLEVDGHEASLEDGRFQANTALQRGINVIEASGVDARGDRHFVRHGVLAGEFADPGRVIDEAARVRLNQGGITKALDVAASMIKSHEIRDVAMAANPVYSDSYGILGWDAVNIRADITDLSFNPVSLNATPATGVLTLQAQIPNLHVTVHASGDVVGWDFGATAWVWATRADVTGKITVEAVGGKLQVDLRDADIHLHGFGYDTSLLPYEIEQYLFVDAIRGFLEDMLVEQIEERVPPLLAEQLEGLDLSLDTELMGRPLEISGGFANAWIDASGIGLDVDLDVHMPSSGTLPYAGYLATPGGHHPDADRLSDVGLAVRDDLLNRVLFEVWRAGVMDLTLSTDDGSLDALLLSQLHADEGTIHVRAKLPPVAVERDKQLKMQIAELEVEILTPGGGLGDRLVTAVALEVRLDLKVDDSVLGLRLREPDLNLVVRQSDWGASDEATTRLLEEMLPINAMLLLLGQIELPLPALAGVSVNEATVSRDSSGMHTGISIGLK